jgi:hypothetical protein
MEQQRHGNKGLLLGQYLLGVPRNTPVGVFDDTSITGDQHKARHRNNGWGKGWRGAEASNNVGEYTDYSLRSVDFLHTFVSKNPSEQLTGLLTSYWNSRHATHRNKLCGFHRLSAALLAGGVLCLKCWPNTRTYFGASVAHEMPPASR